MIEHTKSPDGVMEVYMFGIITHAAYKKLKEELHATKV